MKIGALANLPQIWRTRLALVITKKLCLAQIFRESQCVVDLCASIY